MKILISVLLTLVAITTLGATLVYSGAISFAADEPHSKHVFDLIETARERSIEAHARDVQTRALDDPELIEHGAEHYAAMCEGCHLAPGVDDTELRRGLYPQPPELASREYARTRGEGEAGVARQFWIVKHGLKASGMPAWGVTHDDEAIWEIVAFLQKVPELSPAQYERITAGKHHHADHDAG